MKKKYKGIQTLASETVRACKRFTSLLEQNCKSQYQIRILQRAIEIFCHKSEIVGPVQMQN